MKKAVAVTAVVFLLVFVAQAADQSPKTRLDAAANVLQSLTSTAPDKGIPQEIREGAKCVAVVPGLTKAAFGLGGRWGVGVATCRTNSGWSAPAFFTVTGGSIGTQIGVEKTDLVMMVMNDQGMKQLLSGKFKVGAQASAAAGPVGRQVSGKVGYDSAILTYSRSNGLFAGASLSGAVVQADDDLMKQAYSKNATFREALTGKLQPPASAQQFLSAVRNADKAETTASQ